MTVEVPVNDLGSEPVQTCAACGEPKPDPKRFPNRFCPVCGVSTDEGGGSTSRPVGSSVAGSGPEQIVVSRGRGVSVVVDRLAQHRRLLTVAVGVVAIAGLLWLGFSSVGSGPGNAGPNADAPVSDDAENASDLDAQGQRPSAADRLDIELLESVPGNGAPLGEPVDSYVFASEGGRLLRFDLRTGQLDRFAADGSILTVAGSQLVIVSTRGVYAVAVDSPDDGGRLIFDFASLEDEIGGRLEPYSTRGVTLSDGRVVIDAAIGVPEGIRFASVVIDPSVTGESAVVEHGFVEHGLGWFGSPGLAFVPGLGTFEVAGAQSRMVISGAPVAANSRWIVGFRCTSPVACASPAIERSTGRIVVDDLAGSVSEPWLNRFLSAEGPLFGTWRHAERGAREPGGLRIVNVDSGGEVTVDWSRLGVSGDGPPEVVLSQLAASDDSRFLARIDDGRLIVADLDGGASVAVEVGLSNLVPGQLVFVARANR